jgi:rod shape-determining protein MreD
MLTLTFIIVGLLLVVAQTTVFMPSPMWTASPDFYYILVGYSAYHFSFFRGIIILLPISSVLDVYSGTIIGMYPAICYGGFFLLKFMAARMPVRKSLYQLPLVAVSYLFVCWIVVLSIDFFQPQVVAGWAWMPALLRTGLIYLLSPPLFRVFAFLDRHLKGRISPVRLSRSRPGNQFRQD